jgi:hypothetical protein
MPQAVAEVFHIDAKQKSVSMGRLAKIGRVSVFILTAPDYCAPCRILERKLNLEIEIDSFPKRVDFYFITVDDKTLKHDRLSFITWQNMDQAIKMLPSIFIFSPTGNDVVKIQGYDDQKYQRMKEIIAQLIELSEGINYKELVITELPNQQPVNGNLPDEEHSFALASTSHAFPNPPIHVKDSRAETPIKKPEPLLTKLWRHIAASWLGGWYGLKTGKMPSN